MNVRECYEELGSDYEDVAQRLCDDETVLRFLKMFPDDNSFSKIIACINMGDLDGAFYAAHTLKGICQNLGFKRLNEKCEIICDKLRNGVSVEDPALIKDTIDEYNKTIKIIDML